MWKKNCLQIDRSRHGQRLTIFQTAAVCLLLSNLAHAQVNRETAQKIDRIISGVTDPESELLIERGFSRIITFHENVLRASVADPSVVEIVLLGPQEVELIGKSVGATSVAIWVGQKEAPELLSFASNVVPPKRNEAELKERIQRLETEVSHLFPNSTIRLHYIADKLIVRGQARDAEEATQVMAILRRGQGGGNQGLGGGAVVTAGQAADISPGDEQLGVPGLEVVSLLKVPGEHQVMLKVRIAEIKRAAARKMAADFDAEVGDFLFGTAFGASANALISGTFGSDSFEVVLEALGQTEWE